MTDITNLTFFRIVDKLVRNSMQEVETGMLPLARQALKDTGLPLEEHPVEGYYCKTKDLTDYFNHIRTLQLNQSDKVTDSVKTLHDFYSNEVFGLGQAVKTAINSSAVWFPEEPAAVISPCVDPLTFALVKAVKSPATVKQDLTINNICNYLKDADLGKCLVGLGVLVDKTDNPTVGKFDPVATTLARESTVLSAYVPTARCISSYRVDPEVEQFGNKVIDAYNELFKSVGSDVRIENVSKKNAFSLDNNLPEMDRCVRIYNLDIPGMPKEFYHWAISQKGRNIAVVDFWDKKVVTTDRYKNR